ncbi:hypothetical protein [Mesorhizobium amorphae]|uniref:hypothetical protein n=1 Tax=Mesorhizobium amorphae TaxID=71433 RepID=UPI0017869E4D|nr:hypothetical protein [Mesorhizobium amorphae]
MNRWLVMLLVLFALCLAVIATMTIRPARADPAPCGPQAALLKRLVERFHEFVVLTGAAEGQQMIVTLSASGTFTVLLADGNRACIVIAGEKAQFDNGI